jgi:ubiquinone biosynthesis protein
MKMLKRTYRLCAIIKNLLKYRFDDILDEVGIDNHLGFFRIFFPSLWFKSTNITQLGRGVAIRCCLESLGPIFVKFGQLLSTRRDIVPEDIADALALLQDQVTPFDSKIAQKIIETRFKKPISEIFATFEEHPFASASIAQVHGAILKEGQAAIVKVLRPNIQKQIELDVEWMAWLAKWAHRAFPKLRRFRPIEVVKEFEMTLFDELDLLREAGNASQLKRNFKNSPIMYVPIIYWDYTHHDVLVMERIEGVNISDMATLRAAGTNFKLLAERGVEIFFTQVFRDSFFHADMHPGNIFVDITNPQNPKYVAVDFGIMGSLMPDDQQYLALNFLAFFKRDYRKVAELHVQSGWVPKDTRLDAFEAAIRTVCEPIFERPLKEISFAQTLIRLFQTAQRFNMPVQPQLILLQKTLLSIEGLGRQLYPDLDLWATAKPYLEKWMKQRFSLRSFIKEIREQLPRWMQLLPHLPDRVLKPKESEGKR